MLKQQTNNIYIAEAPYRRIQEKLNMTNSIIRKRTIELKKSKQKETFVMNPCCVMNQLKKKYVK